MSAQRSLMVHDHVHSSATKLAEEFVNHKLHGASFKGATLYVVLKHSQMRRGTVTIKWRLPKMPKGSKRSPWMEVRVLVREGNQYPITQHLTVGTVSVKDVVAKALMDEEWFYEYEDVTFADSAELFVFGSGYGLFKILRKLKVVPGRASKCGMTKFAVEWVKEFRTWREAKCNAVAVTQ